MYIVKYSVHQNLSDISLWKDISVWAQWVLVHLNPANEGMSYICCELLFPVICTEDAPAPAL